MSGRHRLGRPGLTRREGIRSTSGHRARHRRVRRRTRAEGISVVAALATVAVIAVSGWYTASGASAVAQMLAR